MSEPFRWMNRASYILIGIGVLLALALVEMPTAARSSQQVESLVNSESNIGHSFRDLQEVSDYYEKRGFAIVGRFEHGNWPARVVREGDSNDFTLKNGQRHVYEGLRLKTVALEDEAGGEIMIVIQPDKKERSQGEPLQKTLLPIFIFGVLVSIPSTFTELRIYFRTKMKSFFWTGVGGAILTAGFTGLSLSAIANLSVAWIYIVFFALLPMGIIPFFIGQVILWTKESGLWKEICETTSYWQRLTGNVPIVKYEQLPAPLRSRRTGITIGISLMAIGIIGEVFFRLTMNYFSSGPIFMFISGLLLVIFSIIYLNKIQR